MTPMKLIFGSAIISMFCTACIHPKVGLRKAALLDPMMDPSQSAGFADTLGGSAHGNFEKAVVSGGGASGGSCPTCK